MPSTSRPGLGISRPEGGCFKLTETGVMLMGRAVTRARLPLRCWTLLAARLLQVAGANMLRNARQPSCALPAPHRLLVASGRSPTTTQELEVPTL